MEIRKMLISDYNELNILWQNTKGMGLRSLDDSEAGISRFLKRNPNTCFVALIENRIAAAILGGHDGRRGYIYHAVVAEPYRKNGTGKRMVETLLMAFSEEGVNKVALVAFDSNLSGNAFWSAIGFQERKDLVYRDKSINSNNL